MDKEGEKDSIALITKKSEIEKLLDQLISISKCTSLIESLLSLVLLTVLIISFVINGVDSIPIISVVCSYFMLTVSSFYNFILSIFYI